MVEHLGRGGHSSRSQDSMDALDVLETYIEASLEEEARSPKEMNDLKLISTCLSRVRGGGKKRGKDGKDEKDEKNGKD